MRYEDLLLKVEKPARYAGGEYNLPDVKKPHKVSFCLCFPDVYEVAMSNLGIQILYDVLNAHSDVLCERCFAPWTDFAKLIQQEGFPLMSIENRTPLKDFDVVGFSLQYEMCYTNVLYMLELAKIPFRAKDRTEDFPLLIAGGPCSVNPEPFAPFFDAVVIGEGETADLEIALTVADHKGSKWELLKKLQNIEGVYVPALSEDNGAFALSPVVKKAVVRNLDASPLPKRPLVPNLEIIHDRPVVELFRGCYSACRFCQACFFYRPVRIREKETVLAYAKAMMENTGAEELGLSSLSSGDYPEMKELLKELQPMACAHGVNLQLPSLRLDSFSEELAKGARKSSLTFAPEAGTQRLRNVINKNITDEDIDRTMRTAFRSGYRAVKLYFMLGLPTETDADVKGIAEIARTVKRIYFEETKKKDVNIVVSTSLFIPKPLTPFQWAKQISREEMERRVGVLRTALRQTAKGVDYRWHDASTSYLEGIFARGDRKLADLIENAYRAGAKFDGWSEHFKFDVWTEQIEKTGIDPEAYTGAREIEETLPWDFIDFGVKRKFLEEEYQKALDEVSGESCKYGCKGCGANQYVICKVQKRG